jgi:hypothetical protein
MAKPPPRRGMQIGHNAMGAGASSMPGTRHGGQYTREGTQ